MSKPYKKPPPGPANKPNNNNREGKANNSDIHQVNISAGYNSSILTHTFNRSINNSNMLNTSNGSNGIGMPLIKVQRISGSGSPKNK